MFKYSQRSACKTLHCTCLCVVLPCITWKEKKIRGGKKGGGGSQEGAADKTFLFPAEFNIKLESTERMKLPSAVVSVFVPLYHTYIP